ncbi:hypothetical protein HaLaN_07655 [Haematococcus lacustris]|uniref:Uncharacterized protein n=1 Tax=Haematococcus lacustris TaxID=44745 RepID=A0A699YPH9_HAELA|nr:hypothetical protein HaLaN_07655 [Haematococcus lacustris]
MRQAVKGTAPPPWEDPEENHVSLSWGAPTQQQVAMGGETHYEVLGVARTADRVAIRQVTFPSEHSAALVAELQLYH